MNVKDMVSALQAIEDNRNISKDVVIDALKEALAKAYRKQIDIPDALIRVEVNDETGDVRLYQEYKTVAEVEDDELEISLEDARRVNPDIALDELYAVEQDIDGLGRAAALLAKNVMKQKIREAEKQGIYDEYIDKLDEMVMGMIESVEDKFVIINLGKTLAMMPKSGQIPGERYVEGQTIRVIITEVNKETKGAQVLVSRSDAKLVKRLFEKEVPEIFQGIVEIKAIAREAGERTKMAVYSHSPDIDPIGACIGPRGSRVQEVIEEIRGEKIDIFEWSENPIELIKNSLAPAAIVAVYPTQSDKSGLVVVVDDNQLSLAIGKKGKNARLAVRLTGTRIDIKSVSAIEEAGLDYMALMAAYESELQQKQIEKEARKAKDQVKEVVEVVEPIVEAVVEDTADQAQALKEQEELKEAARRELAEAKEIKRRAKKELKPRTEFVSKFENLGETKKTEDEKKVYKRKPKEKEETEKGVNTSELLKQKDYDYKPEYSPEELAEIESQQKLEDDKWDDEVDYDEFDDYYDNE